MQNLKIISWNVNGIRAVQKKGFFDWLYEEDPDILMLQETKAEKAQLSRDLLMPEGYITFWNNSLRKKGYSGTAIFTKYKPVRVSTGLGVPEFDQEGRVIAIEFDHLVIFNIYFPNGKASQERLDFKMKFYEAFQKRAEAEVKKGKKVLVGGDVNTAHHPIDLARPKDNEDISGFLPMEREWMDRFEAAGFHDTFRMFHPEPDQYTWWSMRSGARDRNVGWRIDYFHCSDNLKKSIKDASILPHVMGSDHCPIAVTLELPKTALSNETYLDEEDLCGETHLQPTML